MGRATQLRRRVGSYWSDLRDRAHLGPMVTRINSIEAVVCDSVHEAAWLERGLLEATLPRWNRTAGGQESPVCIRLDPGPARPALSVEYLTSPAGSVPAGNVPARSVESFGPYLGGRRVRLAVKGLGRCLPLALTAPGLRGAELELARIREVTAADRGYFTDTIRAVLRRQPEALGQVRGRLCQLREHASGILAFELAAAISDEIQALEWITCPQRAASMERANFAACGWSDSFLTCLIVRDGKIAEWLQTRCEEADAAPRLAATPPGWAEFAQRNAELAAALSTAS